jgi:hypothetical protein
MTNEQVMELLKEVQDFEVVGGFEETSFPWDSFQDE